MATKRSIALEVYRTVNVRFTRLHLPAALLQPLTPLQVVHGH